MKKKVEEGTCSCSHPNGASVDVTIPELMAAILLLQIGTLGPLGNSDAHQ